MHRAFFLSLVAGLVMYLPTFGAAPDRPAKKIAITVDGRQREYRVLVPDKIANPAPVVLVLHGGGGNAQQMERYTRFDEPAEREGFLVVYPQSVGSNWNDGRGVETIPSQRENVDDVKYMRAVVDDLARRHVIDRARVFATGISNGGMMSHRLAAEASDLVAAIAPVAGGMPQKLVAKFNPEFPVSILIIQGDEDPIVPFAGGDIRVGRRTRGTILPTNETVALYVKRNGNPGEPTKTRLDADPDDETSVEISKYLDSPSGAATELYVVKGGGHTWPGRPRYLPESVIGRASQDFKATDVIWEFFKSCPARRATQR